MLLLDKYIYFYSRLSNIIYTYDQIKGKAHEELSDHDADTFPKQSLNNFQKVKKKYFWKNFKHDYTIWFSFQKWFFKKLISFFFLILSTNLLSNNDVKIKWNRWNRILPVVY